MELQNAFYTPIFSWDETENQLQVFVVQNSVFNHSTVNILIALLQLTYVSTHVPLIERKKN